MTMTPYLITKIDKNNIFFLSQHGDNPIVQSLTPGFKNDYYSICYLHTPYWSQAKVIPLKEKKRKEKNMLLEYYAVEINI